MMSPSSVTLKLLPFEDGANSPEAKALQRCQCHEDYMKNFLKAAGPTILLIGAVSAFSSALYAAKPVQSVREGQGMVTKLGPHASAVTYWVSKSDGWHVVTTIDTASDDIADNGHAIVRFSSLLLPGQSQEISVPATIGQHQPVLHIRRAADRIEVEQDPVAQD
jgi:hypothetical protein